MLGFDVIEGKMAWRNLLANKRRSLLTLVVISIGVVSLLFLSGYINYVKIGFGSVLRQSTYGDFQLYPKGFRELHDESSNSLLFSQEEIEDIEDVLYDALDEEISFINSRLYLTGQISNGVQTSIFMGHGGDVYGETQMKNVEVIEGSLLMSGSSNAIVLGRGLASALGAELGTELILQIPQANGYPLAELGEVVGIVDFNITELNNRYVITDLQLAQTLNDGAGAQRLLVHFDSKRPWDDVYRDAVKAIEKARANGDVPELEYASWLELADYYQRVIMLYNNQLYVFSLIFLLMFFFSISNSLYMSIMERQSEIGTLRAIGISRSEIVRVVFGEGLILGIAGFVVGLLLSFLVQLGLDNFEVYQPPAPGLNRPVRLAILLSGNSIGLFAVLTILVASCATLLPSSKAVRKNIVDAIRTI
ncbi:FtsX-like permease family protein [Candidatus Haliotispira prima]|uniref:FtsX-like permease family protein n=1 Tax=Candidatus Haliotispira prima TaxID=3034016 RepID=A0ABY8MJ18_9SPIO|nr:FtsX-like permease family protein [Candidatus Haliotispira prima]